MRYYREFTLIEQFDVSKYAIWSALYKQLHLALVKIKGVDGQVGIGFSFPEYCYQKKTDRQPACIGLGSKLRIFANSKEELAKLALSLISGLEDYTHLTSMRQVPCKPKGYAIYRRVQVKSSKERLLRRYIKRKEVRGVFLSEEEQKSQSEHYYKKSLRFSDLPYVHLSSMSTSVGADKNYFRLFIEKQEREVPSKSSKFSTYGLSVSSTVPEF